MNNIYDFEVKLTPVYTADNEIRTQVPKLQIEFGKYAWKTALKQIN